MNSAWCGASISRTNVGLILFTLFSVLSMYAEKWDTPGAQRAFQEAQQKRNELAQTTQPSVEQYLECARTFRKVYVKDPHYARAADAIYEEGLLYQELGDRFKDLEYYRTAVKRFQFLISDYGGNQNCPNALVRLGTIFSKHLNDENAAKDVYRSLRDQYNYPKSNLKSAETETVAKPARSQPTPSIPDKIETHVREKAIVQSIRYWSASDYTRVIIDLDADTRYEKSRLPNPDRLYFDIANARLGDYLRSRSIAVGDEFLKQVRVAQYGPDMVRVVLDFSTVGAFSVFELHDPFRIVIDLQRQTGIQAIRRIPASESRQKAESGSQKAVVRQPVDVAQVVQKPRDLVPKSDAQPPAPSPSITMAKVQSQPLVVGQIESSSSKDSKTTPAVSMDESPKIPQTAEIKPAVKVTEPPVRAEAKLATPPAAAPELKPQSLPSGESRIESTPSKEAKPLPSAPSKEVAEAKTESKRNDSTSKPPSTARSELAVSPKAAAPTSQGDRTLTRVLGLKIGRIVIDPGHGGHDLGTVGPSGLAEKDLVLALARILQKLLQEKLGAEVILTRNDDSFIPLEERTEIANKHHADLFISIHANSSSVRSTSGVETYYLNFAQTDSEREVAARENATAVNRMRDLEDLIKKIVQADKAAESKELASKVQKRLYSGARKLFASTQNRGVRRAPFVVLIGANMPSVLAEVAFISNPKDEKLLTKDVHRESLAKALYSGIESYIKTLGSDVVPVKQVQSR